MNKIANLLLDLLKKRRLLCNSSRFLPYHNAELIAVQRKLTCFRPTCEQCGDTVAIVGSVPAETKRSCPESDGVSICSNSSNMLTGGSLCDWCTSVWGQMPAVLHKEMNVSWYVGQLEGSEHVRAMCERLRSCDRLFISACVGPICICVTKCLFIDAGYLEFAVPCTSGQDDLTFWILCCVTCILTFLKKILLWLLLTNSK